MNVEFAIHFFCNIPNWAFDNVVSLWIPELEKHDCISTKSFRGDLPEGIRRYDVLFAMWWPYVENFYMPKQSHQRIFCRIPDYASWNHNATEPWRQRFQNIIPHVDLFISTSEQIGRKLTEMNLPNVVVGDCVDVERFSQVLPKTYADVPIVGWAGDPRSLRWLNIHDAKGFEIVKTLENNQKVELRIASKIPRENMPDWMKQVDILVCASQHEGTPLPVLEAMSCGKLVISTPVGVVPELLPMTSGIHLFDGSAEGLSRAIDELLDRKNEWFQMSDENRAAVIATRSPSVTATKLAELL